MIGGFACVPEPDAALGLNLLEVRAAVGGKQERHAKTIPWSACGFSSLERKAARIPLGLIDRRGNILALPFGLNHADTSQPDKKGIIGRPAFGRPFGNRHGAAFGRSRAGGIGQMAGIRIPAPIAKLLIDDLPCGGLVQVDLLGGFLARLDECLKIGGEGVGRPACKAVRRSERACFSRSTS